MIIYAIKNKYSQLKPDHIGLKRFKTG